ncbi:methyltransferase [Amycolatopsis speibonae]|uniref:Methyltransferase n=1 Tax=Amycolatopsis speibonae TaxID=1450224 RepID=A0ABV7NS73_9PSEU
MSEARLRSDPAPLLRLVEGMHAVEMVIAAVGWLELFDRLSAEPLAPDALGLELGIADRPADVLVTLCQALGLLDIGTDGLLRPSETATEFLTTASPWSMVPCYAALKERPPCRDLLAVLRTGRPAGGPPGDEGDRPDWFTSMGEEDFAHVFLQATDSRSAGLARLFADRLRPGAKIRLLDVAGGSGLFSCALAERIPDLTATVLEQEPVAGIAKRSVAARGLGDRVTVHTGDMFGGPLPLGYDAHLLSNVVHDWPPAKIVDIFAACHRALPPGGTLHVHEAFLDDDKAGPLSVAEYSVLLLMFTEGHCYSKREITDLLVAAGFAGFEYLPTTAGRGILSARRVS